MARLPAQEYGAELAERWLAGEAALRPGSVVVDGRRLAYVEAGHGGQPCVLLHGIGNTWRFWTAVLSELAQGRRVVAFDLPGFGESDQPAGRLDAGSVVSMLLGGCTELGIERANWCGHSLGGLVALAGARQAPERVDRVVVVGGALATILRLYARPAMLLAHPARAAIYGSSVVSAAVPAPARLLDLIAGSPALRAAVLWPYVRHPARLPPRPVRACLVGVGSRGVLRAAANTGAFDLEATARAVTQPVLLLNGAADRFSSPADVSQMERWLARPTVAVVDDAGHWPMVERPAEVAPLIDHFLGA